MSDFVVEGEIAKGSFGVVMRCIRLSDNRQFAIKQVEMKGMNKAEREECIDEARVMSTLDSPYVVRYFDCFIDGTKLCMVMNYAPGGTPRYENTQEDCRRNSAGKTSYTSRSRSGTCTARTCCTETSRA